MNPRFACSTHILLSYKGMATVNLACPLPARPSISLICGYQVSKESNLNPKTLIEFDSGMIVSFIVNGGCGFGKRSCCNEINNEKVLIGASVLNLCVAT